MPTTGSYDVYLLEKGTKFAMISQSFPTFQPQPVLTINRVHDLFISKSVHQTKEENCQDISTSERIDCIVDQVQDKLMSEGNFCLPFQYNQFFPKLLTSFPQCTEESSSASKITLVNIVEQKFGYFATNQYNFAFFRGYGTSLVVLPTKSAQNHVKESSTTRQH